VRAGVGAAAGAGSETHTVLARVLVARAVMLGAGACVSPYRIDTISMHPLFACAFVRCLGVQRC
jgi:hypothetical protein